MDLALGLLLLNGLIGAILCIAVLYTIATHLGWHRDLHALKVQAHAMRLEQLRRIEAIRKMEALEWPELHPDINPEPPMAPAPEPAAAAA